MCNWGGMAIIDLLLPALLPLHKEGSVRRALSAKCAKLTVTAHHLMLFMLRVLLYENTGKRLAARIWRSRLMRHQEVSPQTDVQAGAQAGWVRPKMFMH